MAPDDSDSPNRVNVRVPGDLKRRLQLVTEYDGVTEASLIRPKLMELHRELEDHPAVERETAKAS